MEKIVWLDSVNEVFLICAFAFMREPLRCSGFCIEEGIVLVVQNTENFDRLLGELLGLNAVKYRLRLNGVIDVANYQMVVTIYDKNYRAEVVHDFMAQMTFMPAIITKGIIPRELRSFKNVLVIEKMDSTLWETRKALFDEFICYITDDSVDLLGELKCARKYAERESPQWFSDVGRGLKVVSGVVRDFVNKKMGVFSNEKIHDSIMERYKSLISAYYRPDVEIDMLESASRCLSDFLDRHKEILVGAIDQPEVEFWDACEDGKAIVFDAESYYLSDRILRDSMSEIIEFIPYLRLKQELKDIEALICNAGETDGFTIKKVFRRSDGRMIRPRVLKFSRKRLDGLIHPDIAARRWHPCTSVIAKTEM